ncbi:MAG: sn-glycerol-1-phosphate dehydrogenase [Selenomonas sp.]|nr:sn-glycerol-1-phosphate dehydrogenase [Selenomonas sp.]MBQ2544486.1 sn-glycerol-1-phosphate dehydrogenase [Bacteroidales bacterium]
MNKIERALQRTTDTKDLVIGPGVVAQTASMFKKLFPGQTAIIIADTNTWEVAGKAVLQSLEDARVPHEKPFIFDDPDLYAEWKFVEQLKAHLSNLDAIAIAVGSGVINDLTKYTSHVLGRKYMCVGTAASMDGYTAYGASITKDGNKQTFSCPAPYGFVMDPVIAAAAPKELAASGYADLIAKIPAGADWMLADAVGAEAIDPFGWDLVQDGLRESLSAPAAVHAGDVEMTEKLSEGLLMSGFAMQAIHSSRPASGTEHQFSHCWDMENLAYPNGKHVSHGFKVGIGTLASTASLEFLLSKDIENIDIDKCVDAWKSWPEMEEEIRTVFAGKPGHLARGLEETKGKYVDKEGLRKQLEALKAAWPELKERIREQIIPLSEVYEDLKLVGAPYEPEMICVDRARMRKTFSFIPYMRSRFTNIDIVYRLGLMDELTEKLFGKGGIWEVK